MKLLKVHFSAFFPPSMAVNGNFSNSLHIVLQIYKNVLKESSGRELGKTCLAP